MTSTMKKSAGKRRAKSKMPLPESTEKATIGGTEYLIIPSAEFEEWYTDQMLAAIASERLKSERSKAVPWAEAVESIRKNKGSKSRGK